MIDERELIQERLIQSIEDLLIDKELCFTKEIEKGDCYFDVFPIKLNGRITIDVRHDMTEFFIGDTYEMNKVSNKVIMNVGSWYIENVVNFINTTV